MRGEGGGFPQLVYTANLFGVLAVRATIDILAGRPVRKRVVIDANAALRPRSQRPGIEASRLVPWPSAALDTALAGATLVVNATPLMGPGGPIAPPRLPASALIVDLNYGRAPTPWVLAARGRGLAAYDGLGMLVAQARRSLAVWFGVAPPFGTLARAVGWPR